MGQVKSGRVCAARRGRNWRRRIVLVWLGLGGGEDSTAGSWVAEFGGLGGDFAVGVGGGVPGEDGAGGFGVLARRLFVGGLFDEPGAGLGEFDCFGVGRVHEDGGVDGLEGLVELAVAEVEVFVGVEDVAAASAVAVGDEEDGARLG